MIGTIQKALSGFYYVDIGNGETIACRGRGKLRHQKIIPLVGDQVAITLADDGTGMVDEILPRKNPSFSAKRKRIQRFFIFPNS